MVVPSRCYQLPSICFLVEKMIALKSSKTIQLIIGALESHIIFHSFPEASTLLDATINLRTKGPEGGGSTGLAALLITRVVGLRISA